MRILRSNRTHGATLSEYGILAGLVGVLAVGAVLGTGGQVRDAFSTSQTTLASYQDLAKSRQHSTPTPDIEIPDPGPGENEDEPPICGNSPAIGAVCSNGMVYAGNSFHTGLPLFVTRCDVGMTVGENGCTGTRLLLSPNNGNTAQNSWTITGATHERNGASNTATLLTADSDSAAPGVQPHRAAQHCALLTTHGVGGWYLPAEFEFYALRAHANAIGGINTGDSYLTSTEVESPTGITQFKVVRFSTNESYGASKSKERPVRCFRQGTLADIGQANLD